MADDEEGIEVHKVSLMLEGPLGQDLEVAVLVAVGTQTQGLVTILAHLYAEVEIGEDVLYQNFSPEYHLLILRPTLFVGVHQVALLLQSKFALGRGLLGEVQGVIDEAVCVGRYPLVNR
jgi:hypothetical protein